jgi:hypothetical protein
MVWRLKKGCGRAEAATLGQCKTATMGGGAGRRAAAGWIVRGVGLKEKRVRLTPADPPYHPTSAKCRSGAHYSDSCILRQARPPATAFSGDPQASPITTAYGPHRSPPCSTGRHAGSAAAQLCTSLHYSDARHAAPPPSAGRRVGPTAALLRRPPSVAALGPPPRWAHRHAASTACRRGGLGPRRCRVVAPPSRCGARGGAGGGGAPQPRARRPDLTRVDFPAVDSIGGGDSIRTARWRGSGDGGGVARGEAPRSRSTSTCPTPRRRRGALGPLPSSVSSREATVTGDARGMREAVGSAPRASSLSLLQERLATGTETLLETVLFGYRPLQFSKLGETLLLFVYFEICHYNFSSTRFLPFSTSYRPWGPLSHYICTHMFRMPPSPLADMWAPQVRFFLNL